MSHIILRGHGFHIIVLNVHAPTEDRIDHVKDSFYEEWECIFDKFLKYLMKIMLGNFNAKVGREDIFKPTISLSKVRCSHITTFINVLGHLQIGKPTTRLTTF
jgi:hypothetical protein